MKKLLAVVALLFALPAWAQKADVLHLYNWNDYMSDETIKRFEAFCKCKVKQTYYSDNDELIAKLQAGAKGYDVLVPTMNAVEALIKMKALMPLDKAQLPNLKNVMPEYLNTAFDPGNTYSAPYAMSITLIGYNDRKVKELGVPVDSWATIFDPKILEKIKGKVTVMDSQRELMAAALKYLGYSVNDTDDAHLQEAKAVLLKAKPYWAAFNASSYIKELTVGNIWVAHGFSNDMFQANLDAKEAKRPFGILPALPKEGAVLALDAMVIHKSAPRPDLAHKFINFMLDGKNSADLTNMIGSGNPNADAMQYITPEIKALKAVFPDAETAKKLEMLKDLNSKQRRAMSKIWTEVKVK
ncbi:MAG: spermidine/putrescine ABC transporter substrate-binding protein [Burkholderiales bacterium]|nr:spermidine/putrescine ABC transporter substrate-binding protein [Burkholderiales bacterium]